MSAITRFAAFTVVALLLMHAASLPAQDTGGYTTDEVIAAYEAGQFRVIPTRSERISLSPGGTFIRALDDGIYRISDGTYLGRLDTPLFSRNDTYVYDEGNGIYRTSDFQLVVPVRRERISPGFLTGYIRFSQDEQYVAIDGAGRLRAQAESQSTEGYGVFRLSDGVQLIESDSQTIHFSPSSQYAATEEGIFLLEDGSLIWRNVLNRRNTATFSQDSVFANTYYGIIRLADRRLITTGYYPYEAWFSPDGQYVVDPMTGVYRLNDGQRQYELRHDSIDYVMPPRFTSDGRYVAFHDQSETSESGRKFIYRVADGRQLFEFEAYYDFSPNGALIAIGDDGVYRLSDREKLFEIEGLLPDFSEDGQFLTTYANIYRVSDGTRLMSVSNIPELSPDGRYVALSGEGVFTLSDGKQLFEVDDREWWLDFTYDSKYVMARGDGDSSVYRVADGTRYPGAELFDVQQGILRAGNSVLVVDPTVRGQQFDMIYVVSDSTVYAEPDSTSELQGYVNMYSYLDILDAIDGWYKVDTYDETGWVRAEDVTRVTFPLVEHATR